MNGKRQKNFKPDTSKMGNAYKKIKGDAMTRSVNDLTKRKKDLENDDSPMSTSATIGSIASRTKKSKADEKSGHPGSEKPSQFKKLIDYDEFQEINDFLNFLESVQHGSIQFKKVKEDNETEFDILKKESKKLSHMALGLFDKIGLSFDNFRPKLGTTSTPASAVKPKELEKMSEEKPETEIEDKKEEPKPKTRSRPNIKELLKVNLHIGNNDENDDRLKKIHFEPTLEMMRTSNHIDLEEVSSLIESKKKDAGKNDKDVENFASQKADLSADYQKINELIEGVSEADLQRLEPEVYLNDTLINFYLKFIEFGLIGPERRSKIHIFNTYFMPKMRKLFNEVANDFSKFDKVHEKLERWTKKIDLFEKDFILIPINENEHWDMLILCYPGKLYSKDTDLPYVVYLDSLCRMEDIYAKMLYHFFVREVKTKKPDELPTVQSKLRTMQSNSFLYYQPMVPKQCNWTDCGLYLLQYTEMFADDDSFILKDLEELNKTKWFPRRLISDKREDMKRLIRDLKKFKYEAIPEYIERRNKRLKDYAKNKDQYDSFDEKGFEMALSMKYNGDYLAEEEIAILKLDYYYFGSLDFDQPDGLHM